MTRLAIEKNRVTFIALILIGVGGVYSFFNLPQAEDPGFVIRIAMVATYLPGASPERVENLVTDKIEEVIQEIPELDFVNSLSRTGVSLVFVNIKERHKKMRPIWDDLRRKIDRARGELPEGHIGPFVNDEFGDVFGIVLTMTAEGYTYAEAKEIADQVRDELLGLEEVAKVEIYGAQDERVFVEYNTARLAELGISAGQLMQILRNRNIIIPGGDVLVGRERLQLEPTGNFASLEDLRRTVIKLPNSPEVVYLEDVAEIRRGYIDPSEVVVRANGERALGIGISLREGGNILKLGKEVAAVIADLQQSYPIGIEFELMADQPGRVERKVREFVGNLFQAIAIVMVVMLITLGVRTGLVVSMLIPAAMLMSLLVMSLLDVGLDQMSLAALIISLGMLIDNAIVMSESIMVQMGEGKPALQAAVDSGAELRVPLLTSSLTTAAAFLPIYLAKSSAGEYTGVLFVVVTITLLCSWLLALTMTPLLCVKFLKVRRQRENGPPHDTPFYRSYRGVLLFGLRHRVISLIAVGLLFVSALWIARFIPQVFFPKADRPFFTAQVFLPTGMDIDAMDDVVSRLEEYVGSELGVGGDRAEGVTTWMSFIGGGEPRYILNFAVEQPNPAYAFLLINTSSYAVVPEMIERVEEFCRRHFPDVVAVVQPSDMGPPVEKPIQVRLSGKDPEGLFALVDEVKEKLRSIPGTRNIDDDWGRRTKKILIEVNQPRARRAGVTNEDIAISLQSSLSGIESTEFREDNDLIPITLRSVAAERQDLGKLETLDVYSQTTGQAVSIRQVADARIVWEPSKILRRDRTKTVTVECNLVPGLTATEVNATLVPWLEERSRDWKIGYGYELGGEIESSVKSQKSIGDQMPVAVLIIVLLLVSQFNSFRKPLIILLTIPLGLIGVFYGLLIARSYFGFMTLLGIVSLAGIVINNAIVLIDRIRIEAEEHGRDPADAVVEAAQRRLRPILLTTATTLGGLLPLWIGGGPMWSSMAIAIIFGLAFATMLTLGVVPILYSLFYRVRFRDFEFRSRATTPATGE
jgi:multidrug efflux pump subunit AcrB